MSQVVQVAGPRRAPRTRGPALRGIAQGQGGTATVAFGSVKNLNRRRTQKKKKSRGPKLSQSLECWNAFSPCHLPLPRAVGEYTVTRGTRQLRTDAKLLFIGTWQYSFDNTDISTGAGRNWTDVCAIGTTDLTSRPVDTTWIPHKMPLLEAIGDHAQTVPAACSVQVMNSNALQTTSGMLYIGKMKVQPAYAGDNTYTAGNMADNYVSYMAPRLCSAGKLALRGVHVDAHPLNMNRLADFTQIYRGFIGGATQIWPPGLTPTGFTPIVIYNPAGIEIDLLICQEFRTRFDLFNPASASHKFHQPSTDFDWSSMVKRATELGAGAMDIADIVAKSGLLQKFGGMMVK